MSDADQLSIVHIVRAEWPSFSPPALFEIAKRCYKQVQNGPLVPNRPVCISQSQKDIFQLVQQTGTRVQVDFHITQI